MRLPGLDPTLALLLGATVFIALFGVRILSPTDTDWLLHGDSAMHWLGWQFFRHTPLLQWPLGANWDYGMQIGSSIVFTDSIPLLALLCKPFSPWLPEQFQYIGAWLLLCLCLQSLFAWKLLSRLSPDRWPALLGSLFFTLAPVLLMRTLDHAALVGQWTLLAGLTLYLSRDGASGRWTALLAVTALVHAYLLAMVLALWLADLAQRLLARQRTASGTLRALLAGLTVTGAVMWAAGYFMLGAVVESDGFGLYRMNLASLIDPDDWSRVLPNLPGGSGDYEGFAYLGSGMLGLALVAGYLFLSNPKAPPAPTLLPLLPVVGGLLIFAISDQVAWAGHALFGYALPALARPLANTFRASGRFVWPVYYLLYLAILCLVLTRLPRWAAGMLCASMLAVQVYDSRAAWVRLRDRGNATPPHWPLRANLWTTLGEQYQKLVYIPPHNHPYAWLPLVQFAARHGMTTNVGYFARTNADAEATERTRLTGLAENHALPNDALYIFEDASLWRAAATGPPDRGLAVTIDGLRILAPDVRLARHYGYDLATGRLAFDHQGRGLDYLIAGWSVPEPWGTWSEGARAELLLQITDPADQDLELIVYGMGFVNDRHPSQTVGVLVNGAPLGTLAFDQESPQGEHRIRIPSTVTRTARGRLLISFVVRDPTSPATLGLADDHRPLGLGLQWIELRPPR